jgi:hypothetical protein
MTSNKLELKGYILGLSNAMGYMRRKQINLCIKINWSMHSCMLTSSTAMHMMQDHNDADAGASNAGASNAGARAGASSMASIVKQYRYGNKPQKSIHCSQQGSSHVRSATINCS